MISCSLGSSLPERRKLAVSKNKGYLLFWACVGCWGRAKEWGRKGFWFLLGTKAERGVGGIELGALRELSGQGRSLDSQRAELGRDKFLQMVRLKQRAGPSFRKA